MIFGGKEWVEGPFCGYMGYTRPCGGQRFDHIVFFGENVDIHHIFPKKWCEEMSIKPKINDFIINKTPLAYRTKQAANRGGADDEDAETGDELAEARLTMAAAA